VLVAPDAFKGTLRASEVAAAIGRGLERAGCVPPDLMPVADGGEGTMEVLLLALGGSTGGAIVSGPLGDEVRAGFALLEHGDAPAELGQQRCSREAADAGADDERVVGPVQSGGTVAPADAQRRRF